MAKTEYELLRGAWIKEECHRRDPEARVNAMAGWFDIAPSTLYVWWNANESKANTPGIQTPNVRRIERKFGLAEGGLLRMGVVRKQPGDEDADSLRPATREFMLRGMKTGWIRVDGTGYPAYDPQNIQCFYDDKELVLPPEISRRHKLKAKGIEERREKQLHEGGMPTVFNGLRYHLSGFRTPRTGKGEHERLHLMFGPSDYALFLATNRSLDARVDEYGNDVETGKTLRQRYMRNPDWSRPDPRFANSFGVNLAVVTSDQKLVVTRRSANVENWGKLLHVSMNEGLNREEDSENYAEGRFTPDLYGCAVRGVDEELGIAIDREQVRLLSFGVVASASEWCVLGVTHITESFDQVVETANRRAKDRGFEIQDIMSVGFTPADVLGCIAAHKQWSPQTIPCFYQALVNVFGPDEVEKAAAETFDR